MLVSRNWTAYNAAQSEEKARFAVLLADLCKGVPEPEQVMGRPRLPLSDMVFASAFKVYVGFSSRRFTTVYHWCTRENEDEWSITTCPNMYLQMRTLQKWAMLVSNQ